MLPGITGDAMGNWCMRPRGVPMPLFSRSRAADQAEHAERTEGRLPPDDPRKPTSPTDLPKRSWLGVAKRAVKEYRKDDATDWAAALTYYGVLALFPAMIVLLSLLGLFGQKQQTVDALTKIVGRLGPKTAVDTFHNVITGVAANRGGSGVLFILGLVGAIWSASGYVGAFIRAMNAIYEVREGRKFYILRPLQLLITIVGVLLVTLIALSLVVTGPLAKAIGDAVGLGNTAVRIWSIVKWPVIVIVVSLMIAALYHVAPNVKQPKFRWFTLGGLIALVTWVVASVLFGLYVAHFGNYNKTYGSLGAVIIFLVWLYISNNVLLFGAEVNAELERGRELVAGQPAQEEIQLPHRRRPKG
jgi:membrane protein